MSQSTSGSLPAESTSTTRNSGAAAVIGEPLATDICIIGAGSGGLAVAIAAAAFGRKVVLIERHRMGGSTLNVGSIPSKALLATAKRAAAMRTAGAFGITPVEPQIDYRAVQSQVKGVISSIAPNDSVERLTALGVRVILGAARFLDKRTVLAGDYRISARRFVIATGSSPEIPPIPGLETGGYLTNETIFEVDRKIPHLIVVGAGPIGLELAQAHLRLGSRVTVIDSARALGRDDTEAAAVTLNALSAEGMDIREENTIERVEITSGYVRVHVSSAYGQETIEGSHILIAAGRTPNLSGLNLEAAGIRYERKGIVVGRSLKTSNSRVFAVGDVTGGPHFSHVSSYQAEIVLRRALFWKSAKVDASIIPWITFTDPELAQVGLTEQQARAAKHKVNVLRASFAENDRAIAERETTGHIKVVTTPKGQILGATIVGPNASELIQIWSLAIAQRLNIKAMTSYVAPYPTLGEIGRQAALHRYATLPSKRSVRKLIDFLARLG
jgi:pyruvate/2-oxoglutarate dehydrogenase complex dihydrolipoamide dehydrogenase (E3) component